VGWIRCDDVTTSGVHAVVTLLTGGLFLYFIVNAALGLR
jgi:hypothetical protein